MYNYIINDGESIGYLLDFIFNPLKEKTSQKFRRRYKEYSSYKIEPEYALIFDDFENEESSKNKIILNHEDMTFCYIRAARVYTMLINPDNLKIIMKHFKNFIQIFIRKITDVLTPCKSSYNSNKSIKRPCINLMIHYCSFLLSIQPDITTSYMMEMNTLFTFLITTPKLSDVLDEKTNNIHVRRRGGINGIQSSLDNNPPTGDKESPEDIIKKEDLSK